MMVRMIFLLLLFICLAWASETPEYTGNDPPNITTIQVTILENGKRVIWQGRVYEDIGSMQSIDRNIAEVGSEPEPHVSSTQV